MQEAVIRIALLSLKLSPGAESPMPCDEIRSVNERSRKDMKAQSSRLLKSTTHYEDIPR
jgi:hypothetical protein